MPSGWLQRSIALRIAAAASLVAVALSGVALVAIIYICSADPSAPFTRALAWPLVGGTLALLAVGVAATVALLVRRILGAPLDALRDAIAAATRGDFLIRVDGGRPDELGALGAGFNRLLAKITDLHVNALDADRALQSAQRELQLTNEVAEKARLIQEQAKQTQARLRELELMLAATEAVSSRLDPAGILRTLAEKASRTLGFEECAILLRDDRAGSGGRFVVRATWGFSDAAAIEGLSFEPGEGITGQVAATGEMVLIEDTSRDQRYLHYKGRHLVDGSFCCMPIFDPRGSASGGERRLVGLLNVLRPRSASFREGDLRLLQALARHAALALVNAEMVARLERLSVTDELTGLANRRLFQARAELELKRVAATEGRMSLLMIDIDHFKLYNDTNGHPSGDELLRRVAAILQSEAQGTELLARWGGEEFVVMLPDVPKSDALERAERMRLAVSGAGGEGGSLTISVGVSSFPDDGRTVGSLIAACDRAMFEAKRAGRDRVAAAAAIPPVN